MMPIVNRNSYGYFKIYDYLKGNVPVISKTDASCSQSIKLTHSNYNILEGKITFYFPSNYLCKNAQNEEFFHHWILLACDFFHKVTYLGTRSSSELGMVFSFERRGYREKQDLVKDLGNFVVNDSWCVFEMEIKDNCIEVQNRQYCAYCMIRYMFSDHYDQIIKNFIRLGFICTNYSMKVSEFELFQMSHYYFSGHFGFFQTFVIVHVFDRNNLVYKLLTKEYFNTAIKANKNINNIFAEKGTSSLSVSEFQRKLESNQVKEIYEAIK